MREFWTTTLVVCVLNNEARVSVKDFSNRLYNVMEKVNKKPENIIIKDLNYRVGGTVSDMTQRQKQRRLNCL